MDSVVADAAYFQNHFHRYTVNPGNLAANLPPRKSCPFRLLPQFGKDANELRHALEVVHCQHHTS